MNCTMICFRFISKSCILAKYPLNLTKIMRYYLLFIILISFACKEIDNSSNDSLEGEYENGRIIGCVNALPGRKVLLYELYGNEITLLDSAMAKADGSFKFVIPEEMKHGLYRLAMGKVNLPGYYDQHTQQFDLIWDGNTVVFNTHYTAPIDSMKIILSEENTLYYQFLRRMKNFDRKINVLSSALLNYPDGDNFYRRLERQHRRVQNRRFNYIDNMIKKNTATIFSIIASFQKPPWISSPADPDELTGLKQNFFYKGQFSDPVLLQTDLIPRKIMRYLSLYAVEKSEKDDREEDLIYAADVIMQHAMDNETVSYYVLQFLINGFESMDYHKVSKHLMERYLGEEICFKEDRLPEQIASAQGEGLVEGARVPGFSITAHNGHNIEIDNIQAEYTLILFWGSWCYYCEDVMDDLYIIYSDFLSRKEGFLEVVAIGIENDKQMWLDQIERGGYDDWINYSSMKRWDCPIVQDYNLIGTPTMFLLDDEKRFLFKPVRVEALNRYLSRRLE